jgi:predicted RND superfamily exporter protein
MLMFSNFLGFRHFGFIAGTGILLAYIAYMVILPAILTIANDLTGGLKILPVKQSPSLTKTPDTGATLVKHSKPFKVSQIALVICICITIICVWKTMNVSFEYDFRNLRSQIPGTREFNQKMRKVFKAARDPAAVMIRNEQDEKNIRRYLKENNLLTIQSPVEDVKSIDDLIPADQEHKLQILQEIKRILDQNRPNLSDQEISRIDDMSKLLVNSPMTTSDIPGEILKLFLGTPGSDGQLMYLYQRNSLLDLHNAEEFSNAVGKMTIDNHDYYAVSEPLVYVDLIKLLKRDSIFAIIGAFLIITIIIFFDFGKVRSTLIILSSLCIGIIWMLGIMGIFSLKLNIFNMVILPSILGLGVDAAVHIYHSFEDNFGSPMGKLLIKTGGPNILCTLINLVGFGGIITAVHPGLQSIGKLAIIGMSTCLVAALCVIPAILVLIKKRQNL